METPILSSIIDSHSAVCYNFFMKISTWKGGEDENVEKTKDTTKHAS